MTEKKDPEIDVSTIDYAKIDRVYSGKPGCMCGCRGTYSSNKGQITRVINKMKAIEKPKLLQDGYIVYVSEDRDTPNTHAYVIYLKEGVTK